MVTAAVCWDLYSKLINIKFILINFSFLSYSTGQVSDPILSNYTLQSPVFLLNSRHPLFRDTLIFFILKHSFSRSYRVNLPSSFSIVISYTLVFSTYSPVSVLVRSFQIIVFSRNLFKFLYNLFNIFIYLNLSLYFGLLNFNSFPIKNSGLL